MKQSDRFLLAKERAADLRQAADRLLDQVSSAKGPTLVEIHRIERAARDIKKIRIR